MCAHSDSFASKTAHDWLIGAGTNGCSTWHVLLRCAVAATEMLALEMDVHVVQTVRAVQAKRDHQLATNSGRQRKSDLALLVNHVCHCDGVAKDHRFTRQRCSLNEVSSRQVCSPP